MTQSAERKVSREPKRNDEPQAAPVAPPQRYATTMAELGDKLPVGILDSEGRLHKEIVTKPWRTRDERELGRKLAPDAQISDHVPLVVSSMCSRIGPHDMDGLDDAKKGLILSTMYMADVFYAYALLRMKTMGSRLPLTVACPRGGCGVRFPYVGDMTSIEVMAVDDIDAILWSYELADPLEIRRKRVTHFRMAYPKWSVMEQSRGVDNEADIKANVIQASIVGLNDEDVPVALTLNEIDELSKRDFEGIQEGVNQHFLGPKMGIEGQCTPTVCTRYKRGGFDFKIPIDWSYKSFFGASSR